MKTTCSLGSEKMPIVLDQTEGDSNSGSQSNFNILHLVHKQTEYSSIQDQNFNQNIELNVGEMGSVRGVKGGLASQTETGKKDWNLKYDIFQSDKLNNFSCSDLKGKENDIVKDESCKKMKKKVKHNVTSSVNMQTNYQNSGDSMNSQDVFVARQIKMKQTGNKGKKGSNKLKEKINGIKKGYKLIAPYPSMEDQKITVVQNPVQKVLNSQMNPILIVKIDEQRVSGNKGKVPEYLEYSDKKLDDSEFVNSYNFESSNQELGADLKNKKNFMTRTKCFKCCNCSFMTLNKDFLNYHFQKKEKCCTNNEVFHCPGCKNVFFSLTPLRVHLVHDHRILLKEAKIIIQNIQEIRLDVEREKSSCVFESSNQMSSVNGDMFNSTMTGMDLPLSENREEMGKSFCGMSSRVASRDLESYGSGKRQTMLESYLDDINNKGDCNLPPSLNHNGSALLENTFNFTAPVSEQLPSIQPPPAHSSSNSLLDQSHLMVEHQNHGFMGMTNVFDARDQSVQGSYKSSEPPHYPDEANMMLSNGNYLSSHIQDIPVINLDDNNLEKSSANILTHEINIEDFSSYQENEPGSLEPDENDCPLSVEDEDQEEKKKLKKLGVGYRCDINGCKVRLQSEKNIQYHRRCHEGTLYNCPECCKDCSTWVSLSSHLWQAHKIDMELYKCDQCPYKTPSYSRLTNIHRGIHGKARPFLCDICGKGFKTVKQMRNHKNIHKAKMVRMSVCHCEICGRTVADKRQLELHINNTHKKKKPYLCYMCGYASAVKHSLVVHMRRHTGEKPYACEKCEYKTADHNALRRHKMKHSGVRNYKCNHCSYTCIQASTYKVHLKTKHPGLETDVIFSCSQCNFQTLNRGSFLSHTSEHENFNGQVRKTGSRGSSNSKPEVTSNGDYYGEATNRMDLVGPIITERVVETIVDLSGAQTLLEQDDYYDVERITGDLDEAQELKFKTSGIT